MTDWDQNNGPGICSTHRPFFQTQQHQPHLNADMKKTTRTMATADAWWLCRKTGFFYSEHTEPTASGREESFADFYIKCIGLKSLTAPLKQSRPPLQATGCDSLTVPVCGSDKSDCEFSTVAFSSNCHSFLGVFCGQCGPHFHFTFLT